MKVCYNKWHTCESINPIFFLREPLKPCKCLVQWNRYFVTNATSQSQSVFGINHKWEVANLLPKRPEKQHSYFFQTFYQPRYFYWVSTSHKTCYQFTVRITVVGLLLAFCSKKMCEIYLTEDTHLLP